MSKSETTLRYDLYKQDGKWYYTRDWKSYGIGKTKQEAIKNWRNNPQSLAKEVVEKPAIEKLNVLAAAAGIPQESTPINVSPEGAVYLPKE